MENHFDQAHYTENSESVETELALEVCGTPGYILRRTELGVQIPEFSRNYVGATRQV